jgi:lysozyme family protein
MTLFNEKFEKAVAVVLKHEGGYSDNPKDPGGATQHGISLRYLLEAKLDLNHDGKVNADDIRQMTVEQAKNIYWRDWWLKYRYDEITSTLIATKVFDLAVNMGGNAAHKVVQRAINMASPAGLVVDGILGKRSFAALNTIAVPLLMEEICSEAQAKYKRIVAANPNLAWALKGLLNRAAWGL